MIVTYKFFGILVNIHVIVFAFSAGFIIFFFGKYSANIFPKLFNCFGLLVP